jgi:hypothetical protein
LRDCENSSRNRNASAKKSNAFGKKHNNVNKKQNASAKKSNAFRKKHNNMSKKQNASAKKTDITTNEELARLYYLSFSMLIIPTSLWA